MQFAKEIIRASQLNPFGILSIVTISNTQGKILVASENEGFVAKLELMSTVYVSYGTTDVVRIS